MSNDKYKGISDWAKGRYDSDEDLPEEERAKIAAASLKKQDEARKAAWESQGMYPKLKRIVKGAWEKDIRKPSDEE